jgi:hypothetical protein
MDSEELPPPAVRRYMWRDEETGQGFDSFESVAVVIGCRAFMQWLPPHLDEPTKQMIAVEMARALYERRDNRAMEAFGKLTALVEIEPARGADGLEIPVFPNIATPRPVVSMERKKRGLFQAIIGGKG